MSGMFSGCNLTTSLNLSSFNTLNTIDMSEMFYGCDNLEILDISNFDATNCKSYNNMFSNYVNLKYIDIKNLKDDKIIKDSFKNTKLFYVCQ
jgi:surface protein